MVTVGTLGTKQGIRTPADLHAYQQRAINHQCVMPRTMLWLDPGLGKTAITLTTIAHLIKCGFLRGVIIVAPVRVCKLVWRQEAAKWAHTKHLTFSMLTGDRDSRTRALLRPADVYLINYENLGWLAETLHTYFVAKKKPIPFNGLVWDEISKCKNSTTQRVKSFLKIEDHFDWVTGLTGTPASNGYQDLHGQFLVVDKGERLGRYKTAFRAKYYYKETEYKYKAFKNTEEDIKAVISDITLEMSAEDYNPLPDMIVNNIELEMDGRPREVYERLEKEFFAQLDSGKDVEVFNQAALTNKLLQVSNGSVYPVAGLPIWEPIHELKLDALEDIIEEAQGNPVLCSYAYRSDADRIMERFKAIDPINLTECKSERALQNAMARWQSGDCRLMIGHPACLHPRTQVLTETRGWVRIVDVKPTERVFDGVEFVSHDGCSYSGYKDVIDVFGITMTPDHRILVNGRWEEAERAGTRKGARGEALYRYQGSDPRISEMFELRARVRNSQTELRQAQPKGRQALFGVRRRDVPQYDLHPILSDLAWSAEPGEGHQRERRKELWEPRNFCRPTMGIIRCVYDRYVSRLRGTSYDRTHRRERSLLQGELHLGIDVHTAGQQADQSRGVLPGRDDASSGIGQTLGCEQDDAGDASQSWYEWRRSRRRRDEFVLREGSTGKEKADVFDLINCGPRHQFLIRNDEGEMFISHNSMGHGIDGLQKGGRHLVWFGLTWSLDLYEQFNARIRRQGQGASVVCHRILVANTMDQAQAIALDEKATTQNGLRNAVKQYRMSKGV